MSWNEDAGDPLLTCHLVDIFFIVGILICKMLRIGLDFLQFLTFMIRIFLFPLNSWFGIIVTGIIFGAQMAVDIWNIVLDLLGNYVSSFCPDIIESLNNIPDSQL